MNDIQFYNNIISADQTNEIVKLNALNAASTSGCDDDATREKLDQPVPSQKDPRDNDRTGKAMEPIQRNPVNVRFHTRKKCRDHYINKITTKYCSTTNKYHNETTRVKSILLRRINPNLCSLNHNLALRTIPFLRWISSTLLLGYCWSMLKSSPCVVLSTVMAIYQFIECINP